MIKIGLTGSIASGKTTAGKIISRKRGPLFSADKVVDKLYRKKSFKKFVARKLKFKFNSEFKKIIKNKILKSKETLKKLEKIIHPIVRREMFIFLRKNKNKKLLFFEIPLLVESKLMNFFDVIIFIKSKKNLRLKRYKLRKGNVKLFSLLDKHQLKDTKKMKLCNHIVVNNKSLTVLKKNLLNIIKLHE
ncbi:dephospho-CoA kinase [Pelagibacterales bacterium SAG-MED05]|nr:dephospho-CoA kinase [Pelagibacterales bacterium SAG-MED05]